MLYKLYKAAYWSSGVVMLLGLICLDDYIHTAARIPAGLLATSPYWLHYCAIYKNTHILTGEKHVECEHEFQFRTEGYRDPIAFTYCTKCGLIRK